ncbi:MAG: NrdH-redoxin [Crenarchaeota archaeon]|nr:NrdH-redoxin [Thermoproteota archaeon]
MITVIGTPRCSKCEKVIDNLKIKKIEYQYKYITDYSNKEQDELLELAKANNQSSFPLIIREGQLITEGDI